MQRRNMLKNTILGLAMLAPPARTVTASTATRAPVQRQRVPWRSDEDTLQLALTRRPGDGDAVLFVHGATFPAALSADWRMHGMSWLDHWQQAGLDAWALDFAGYGDSDRPRAFAAAPMASPPFGRCSDAAAQIGVALRHIRQQRPGTPIHVVAHSWGTLPAQQAAIDAPHLVSRLVLFGPVVIREGTRADNRTPAWTLLDEAQQRPRHRTGLPEGEPTPVDEAEIDRWCGAYLNSDPTSMHRTPRSVKVPNGPSADITALWAGHALLDTARIRQPVLIVRGAWDHVTTDQDARRLFDALTGARDKRDVKISGGNHWLHLQPRREALWAETLSFLCEGEHA